MKRAGFAVLAVLCAFLLAEIGLRLAGFRAPAPVLDYRLRLSGDLHGEPDAHRFWRLPNRAPHFGEDAFKIICLADSVTVMENGRGYPEDLPAAFAHAGFPGGVEVFNAGVPEYTVFQGRVYLERELLAFGPDLVTVQFGINDHWPAPGGVPDALVKMPRPALLKLHRALLASRSYQALRTATLAAGRDSGPKPLRVGKTRYVENLEKIADLCKREKARVVFVLAPYLDKTQGWAPLHREYMALTLATGERLGVPVVDVTARFRFSPELFLDPARDDVHFNRRGGPIIAGAIADALIPMLQTGKEKNP